jgi:predicted transcriptional regulator
MSTQHRTDAEAFQLFLAEQVAGGAKDRSPEDLVRHWRERERESVDAIRAVREGLADVEAGRVFPFAEVNDEIRRQHGWPTPQ